MDHVILFRGQRGGVGFISDSEGEEIEVFPDRDAAVECALRHPVLRSLPYQIVELDEL